MRGTMTAALFNKTNVEMPANVSKLNLNQRRNTYEEFSPSVEDCSYYDVVDSRYLANITFSRIVTK